MLQINLIEDSSPYIQLKNLIKIVIFFQIRFCIFLSSKPAIERMIMRISPFVEDFSEHYDEIPVNSLIIHLKKVENNIPGWNFSRNEYFKNSMNNQGKTYH